jgi:hypothetical protein
MTAPCRETSNWLSEELPSLSSLQAPLALLDRKCHILLNTVFPSVAHYLVQSVVFSMHTEGVLTEIPWQSIPWITLTLSDTKLSAFFGQHQGWYQHAMGINIAFWKCWHFWGNPFYTRHFTTILSPSFFIILFSSSPCVYSLPRVEMFLSSMRTFCVLWGFWPIVSGRGHWEAAHSLVQKMNTEKASESGVKAKNQCQEQCWLLGRCLLPSDGLKGVFIIRSEGDPLKVIFL